MLSSLDAADMKAASGHITMRLFLKRRMLKELPARSTGKERRELLIRRLMKLMVSTYVGN